jgi:UDP-N-acetylglucosamine 2-epimerase (non-hydrolysing)
VKVLIIFGTRPEAIKMAPVYHALNSSNSIEVITCITAQHREMLDQVIQIFDLKIDYDLNLMKKNQSLTDLTALAIVEIEKVINLAKPDLVLVHGDTTTSLAASIVSFYLGKKIGHVEAGLRTNNLQAPFPEEFNRQVSGLISSIHFAPTELSKKNLLKEGKNPNTIFITGNTVIDSLYWVINKLDNDLRLQNSILGELNKQLDINITSSKYILITGHRRENFGKGFSNIFHAIKELSNDFPELNFIYPVHLNPKVRVPVSEILGDQKNVKLIEPQDYIHFILLLKNCHIVMTDSGGIQEEAPSLGKPVLVLRETTERPEAVEAGTVKLVGSSKENIVNELSKLMNNEDIYNRMANSVNPYGDGLASQRICKHIRNLKYEE